MGTVFRFEDVSRLAALTFSEHARKNSAERFECRAIRRALTIEAKHALGVREKNNRLLTEKKSITVPFGEIVPAAAAAWSLRSEYRHERTICCGRAFGCGSNVTAKDYMTPAHAHSSTRTPSLLLGHLRFWMSSGTHSMVSAANNDSRAARWPRGVRDARPHAQTLDTWHIFPHCAIANYRTRHSPLSV